ncbi:hypothetical protein DR864_09540 [Runella rosea]|uniref:Helix-turn-helix domain-containing protein n=1 Tax=Runella rosea TaxID=2259595 RepID=A0A344TH39_9BACT|nr:helix-turn-helix domain-containing protein [Runella rosea]AXE17960.1 hypothetical protein DR864_09540 [Runella rosea]
MTSNIRLISPSELESLIVQAVNQAFNAYVYIRNKDDALNSSPELMGTAQAAVFLNISEATLYKYTSMRLIPFKKRSQKLYFSKKDLLQWLEVGPNPL